MADEALVLKVRALGDIELAALLCLISREHCIISTEKEYLDDLTAELQLVASQTFGLASAVVNCTPETTLEDFVTAIQLPQPRSAAVPLSPSSPRARGSEPTHRGADGSNIGGMRMHTQHQPGSPRPLSSIASSANVAPTAQSRISVLSTGPQQHISNVILARDLDTAPKTVQIQCLELMRTRRILTRTTVQACPKQFLLIAVLGSESAGQARLTKHLNNHIYISHWHDPEDGFAHLDERDDEGSDNDDTDQENDRREGKKRDEDGAITSEASSASVVRRTPRSKTPSTPIRTSALLPGQQISATDWEMQSPINHPTNHPTASQNTGKPLLTETEISTLSTLSLQTHVDIEVHRYQMNIIAFLRLHRAVTPGSVPPLATTHFRTLLRSLAALHGLDFATPEMVQLAARKIYAHRIAITPPGHERSMQWGSDLTAVRTMLEGVRPEDVVEDVIKMVEPPV
ncbi:hypothetical protein GGS21DRAFT_496897 [Xylaria nigripes]|nr:hypothetical protein GGS21DRAFT_496897 [Xylaria nigripes]